MQLYLYWSPECETLNLIYFDHAVHLNCPHMWLKHMSDGLHLAHIGQVVEQRETQSEEKESGRNDVK